MVQIIAFQVHLAEISKSIGLVKAKPDFLSQKRHFASNLA